MGGRCLLGYFEDLPSAWNLQIWLQPYAKSKCDDLANEGKTSTMIETAALDADKVEKWLLIELQSQKPFWM